MNKTNEKKLLEKIEMLEMKVDLLAMQLKLAGLSDQSRQIYIEPVYIPGPYHPYGYPTITCNTMGITA